jgi:hypothetical protein
MGGSGYLKRLGYGYGDGEASRSKSVCKKLHRNGKRKKARVKQHPPAHHKG